MPEPTPREAFLGLIRSALGAATSQGRQLSDLRGVALFDPQRDRALTELPEFEAASGILARLPHFEARFGASSANRICLQLAFDYFGRLTELALDQAAFDRLWADFIGELDEPNWRWRGVANLRHFAGPVSRLAATGAGTLVVPLTDGISIRERNFGELSRLGFDEPVAEQLQKDWHESTGASSFVLVVDHRAPKSPDNLILMESAPWVHAMRAIGAMRLVGDGDVGIGPMWIARVARVNPGVSGAIRVGSTASNWGHSYDWTDAAEARFPDVYDALVRLERSGYQRGPGNLDVALRYFMATYDRWPIGNDSRLLDTVTSLEAVLGSETEISFRLAFRVASILAASDDERSGLLKEIRAFYDVRSRLVHGGTLRTKHGELLGKVDRLRAVARSLLGAFVLHAAGAESPFDRKFFSADLDSSLVHAGVRDELRRALGLG